MQNKAFFQKTLAAVDSQQAEWTRRTEDRERALEEQTKMITEAWLNLESERRAKLQHGAVNRTHSPGLPPTANQPAVVANQPIQHNATENVEPSDINDDTDANIDPSGQEVSRQEVTPNTAPTVETNGTSMSIVANASPLDNVSVGAAAPNIPVSNPTIDPIDPWQSTMSGNSPGAAAPTKPANGPNASSDAVKQFKRLRRAMRGK